MPRRVLRDDPGKKELGKILDLHAVLSFAVPFIQRTWASPKLMPYLALFVALLAGSYSNDIGPL